MFHCCSSNQAVVEMELELNRERWRDEIGLEVAVLDCTHRISLPVSNAVMYWLDWILDSLNIS